jgi:hypothetical protein
VRSTSVPDAFKAMNFLIKAYLKFPPVRFHKWFCLQEDAADVFWPENYDPTAMDLLPPSIRHNF